MTTSEQILQKAMELSSIDRAELVEQLLTSFEFSDRKRLDDLWSAEVESRIEGYNNGDIQSVSFKDIQNKVIRQK